MGKRVFDYPEFVARVSYYVEFVDHHLVLNQEFVWQDHAAVHFASFLMILGIIEHFVYVLFCFDYLSFGIAYRKFWVCLFVCFFH